MRRHHQIAAIAALAVLAASPVLAHPGHGPATFVTGLAHPFSGLDHMLAMIAVGLWAASQGGRARWAWPCGFVAAMLAGYGLGLTHPGLPVVEPAILASIVILGALVAASVRAPFAVGLGLIGVFGLCHGYAHGAEAPAGGGLGFPLGFAISTATLHLIGLGLGVAAQRLNRPGLVRFLGAGVVAGGIALAFVG
jgi:urease accessory protein